MTDIKKIISELKKLDGARTPNHHFQSGGYSCKCDSFLTIFIQRDGEEHKSFDHMNDIDSDYVAAAANATPRLIEHIEGLEKELQESANRIFNAKIEADKALSYCKYDETPFNHLKTIRDYLDAASPPPKKGFKMTKYKSANKDIPMEWLDYYKKPFRAGEQVDGEDWSCVYEADGEEIAKCMDAATAHYMAEGLNLLATLPHLKTGEVIDVEGAAKEVCHKYNYWEQETHQRNPDLPKNQGAVYSIIAAIIRKYIKPIEVVWKEGIEDGQHLALWGESFELEVYSVELKDSQIEWYWQITFLPRANGQTGINASVDRFPTQQTAQSACLEALNRIINGQKEECDGRKAQNTRL